VQQHGIVRTALVDRLGQLGQARLDLSKPGTQLPGDREGHHRQRAVGLQIRQAGGHPARTASRHVRAQDEEARGSVGAKPVGGEQLRGAVLDHRSEQPSGPEQPFCSGDHAVRAFLLVGSIRHHDLQGDECPSGNLRQPPAGSCHRTEQVRLLNLPQVRRIQRLGDGVEGELPVPLPPQGEPRERKMQERRVQPVDLDAQDVGEPAHVGYFVRNVQRLVQHRDLGDKGGDGDCSDRPRVHLVVQSSPVRCIRRKSATDRCRHAENPRASWDG
jgi:hypothetical protein